MAEAGCNVRSDLVVVSTCNIISASIQTPPHYMFLAAPDILFRIFHYNRRILFFNTIVSDWISFVAHLKSSLALALVHFFPWAGRLFELQEAGDGGSRRLTLDCNDAGVPFIEASLDLPFSTVQDDEFRHQPFFDHLAPHGDVLDWTGPHLPLLSIQVTRFRGDEGFALGIGHSHVVADGNSLWHFIKSWGECTRGVPLSLHPVHMREELRPEKLILPPPWPHSTAETASELHLPPMPALPAAQHGNVKLEQRDFHFTSEMVRKLKRMAIATVPALESGQNNASISSFQSLSAHMWRHVMKAAASCNTDELDKSRKCELFMMVNMRTRAAPPLQEAYFGNLIVRGEVVATEEELEAESLGATALRIHQTIKTMDEKLMRRSYGMLEVWPVDKLIPADNLKAGMLQPLISGSPRFPVYEVDFGSGAVPVCVRCPRLCSNGEMMWSPGREGGGSIDISLALAKDVMDSLEQDESFFTF